MYIYIDRETEEKSIMEKAKDILTKAGVQEDPLATLLEDIQKVTAQIEELQERLQKMGRSYHNLKAKKMVDQIPDGQKNSVLYANSPTHSEPRQPVVRDDEY